MGEIKSTINLKGINRQHIYLSGIFIFSCALFFIAGLLREQFDHVMSLVSYLTWHNIFELTSVLVSLCVFFVSYYTYDQTRKLRSVFLGSIFLFIGMIDGFHALSFKGMPEFLIENYSANRATTFWIIARLVGALGFLTASYIHEEKESALTKKIFVVPSLVLGFLVLIIVTYYPEVIPPMFIEEIGLTPIKVILEYVIVLLLFISMSRFMSEYKRNNDFLTVMFCGALLLGIFSEFAFISYIRVYDVFNYLGHIYKFIAYFIIFKAIFISNVQKPYVKLSDAQKTLKDYVDNLDRIVEQRTKQLNEMNKKFSNDLEYARDIQRAIMPFSLLKEKEVSFSNKFFPAERVSGDFYNIFKLDEENIALYIGDVSGHGVPAAMLTIFVDQYLKTTRDICGCKMEIPSPSVMLKTIYESFNETNFKDEVYIVLLYAVYNIKNRELTYASAGINVAPAIVTRNGKVLEIPIQGFPICKFAELYTPDYKDMTIKLNQGDKVLFYTDGLVESCSMRGEPFSEERLKSVLIENSSKPGEILADIIVKKVFDFIDVSKITDDISFFVMEVK